MSRGVVGVDVVVGASLPDGAALILHCRMALRLSFIAGRRYAFPAYVTNICTLDKAQTPSGVYPKQYHPRF